MLEMAYDPAVAKLFEHESKPASPASALIVQYPHTALFDRAFCLRDSARLVQPET